MIDFPRGVHGVLHPNEAAESRECLRVLLQESHRRGRIERSHVDGDEGGQADQFAVGLPESVRIIRV